MSADERKSPAAVPTVSGQEWRRGRFPQLMRRRIEEILLVASPYDSFILEEDGLLTEMITSEFQDLGLSRAPTVTRASTGEEALAALRSRPFDLVITLMRLGDMDVARFGAAVREFRPDLPVVLLIANQWELARVADRYRQLNVDSAFVWQGDTKIFLAMVKALEDRLNAEHDTRAGDVGVIIIVEDSLRFRSSLLPIIYTALVRQTRAVMADSLNYMDKRLRMTARPKILLAENYEEGLDLFRRFRRHIFGIISDVSYPRGGRLDPQAGIGFLRQIRTEMPDVPTLLQSSDAGNWQLAERLGVSFLHKRSATLADDIRAFMLEHFGFGEFVFRMPDGRELARAADLPAMVRTLRDVPIEAVEFHARHNHFSTWFRARTEFALARDMRPRRVSEFQDDLESLRRFLIRGVQEALRRSRRGLVEDFSSERWEAGASFARIGGGSLGGKARGLAFLNALLAGAGLEQEFPEVRIVVPRSVVIGADIFDEFLHANQIRPAALGDGSDDEIRAAFLAAQLPRDVVQDLAAFLAVVREPIAVRSSSVLEDSQYHPFAGVYDTRMLPNNAADAAMRLGELVDTVKLVYASTFYAATRRYLEATPHRIDEEKMAVILQPVVGARHGDTHYPNFAGVARSYNYYPFGAMRPEDGVATVALGLGKTVVEGGDALRFCPAAPQILPQLADVEAFIAQSQRTFFAVDLRPHAPSAIYARDCCLAELGLDVAEQHGTLHLLGSTWNADNAVLCDGVHSPGVRMVTFAHVLKNESFPLAALLRRLLGLGRAGMNNPVELEFAVNLEARPPEFAVLQLRPCGIGPDAEPVDLADLPRGEVLCFSHHALGNGVIAGIRDIVYVRPENFDPGCTPRIAQEITEINERLLADERPYLLIGPGRWGSSHATLGIPVSWSNISAARIIVETTLQNFVVEPSQGSHFFQNLTAFGIAYLTVNPFAEDGFVDWAWLDAQAAERETPHLRHLRLAEPLEGLLDGQVSRAAVLKHGGRR